MGRLCPDVFWTGELYPDVFWIGEKKVVGETLVVSGQDIFAFYQPCKNNLPSIRTSIP